MGSKTEHYISISFLSATPVRGKTITTKALKINKPSLLYYISLELLEAHMKSGAKGRKLYSFLLTAKQDNSCNLVGRCQEFCQMNEMSLYSYLFDGSYRALCKRNLKAFTRDNGLFDTLSFYMNDIMENRDITLCNFYCQHIECTMFTFLHLEGWNNKYINKQKTQRADTFTKGTLYPSARAPCFGPAYQNLRNFCLCVEHFK